MAVSPDGSLLAAGRTMGQGQTAIRLQRTDTKQLVQVVFVPQSPLLGLAFHPNGKQLAVQSAQVLSIWHVETGKQLQTYPTTQNMVRGIAYSASGKLLFAPTQKGAVMWNTSTHKRVASPEAPGGKQHSVRLLPDETVLLVGGTNALLRLDVTSQTSKNVTFQEPVDATISLQHISTDGRWVANYILADKKVYVLDTETGKLVTAIVLKAQAAAALVTAMVFSPDGSWLAIGSQGRLARWSLTDGQMIQEMPAPSTGYAAPSHTQMVQVPKRQALAYAHDKGLVYWDFGGNKAPVTATRSMASKQSLWHEASSALWVTGAAGTVQSWNRPASSPALLSYQGFGS
jgi:WD40 repeat protein